MAHATNGAATIIARPHRSPAGGAAPLRRGPAAIPPTWALN